MPDIDYRQFFDRLPSPYIILDRNYRYVAANAAYEAAVMRSSDELIGWNLFDIFPNEDQSGAALRASFERVFTTGEPDTIAYIPYDIPLPQARGGGMEKRYWTGRV